MRSDYFEKRENRVQRFKELAAKNDGLSTIFFKRAVEMTSCIPMGQPILVGHHSERGHRNLLKRSNATMGKSVEASQKAGYYDSKAEAAENNTAISSDNPNAVQELEKKLAEMVKFQDACKTINKIAKSKKLTLEQKQEQLDAAGFGRYKDFLAPDFCGRIGVPAYKLTNNNANMKRVRDRIEQLKKLDSMEAKEVQIGEVKIVSGPETNRVQIFFPGKPSEEIRQRLKSNGFRWSPSEGAWQRMLSAWAQHLAESIAKDY